MVGTNGSTACADIVSVAVAAMRRGFAPGDLGLAAGTGRIVAEAPS
jgi:hypothetical protein